MPADRLIHPRLGRSEKVSSLSDFEFRVWVTYLMASDDYGVMRQSAVTVQAASEVLAERPAKAVEAALARLVDVGLLHAFEHQGRRYVYQETWQNFQRVKHPRDTMQPMPPADLLALCTPATQKLFAQHPSNSREELPQDFGNISEMVGKKKSENGSLARVRAHETANGLRLTATEGVQGEAGDSDLPPMDIWTRELVNLYPAQGRCGWNFVERPLYAVLTADPDVSPREAWESLKARLEQQKRSAQWRAGKIPRLDRWLEKGLHLQELPEDEPVEESRSDARVPAWAR